MRLHRIPIFMLSVLVFLTLESLQPPARAAEVATNWKQIEAPPLHAFHPQLPKRIQLSNGMIIFLQEDHELPLIRGTARIRGGSVDGPPDKVGLVRIYGGVSRTGGPIARTGGQLDHLVQAPAARVQPSGTARAIT